MAGEGPDHQTHDFPSSHLGIKLGGFMTLHAATPCQPFHPLASAKLRIGPREHTVHCILSVCRATRQGMPTNELLLF